MSHASKLELLQQYYNDLNNRKFNTNETLKYMNALMNQVPVKNRNTSTYKVMKNLRNAANAKVKANPKEGGKHKKHTRKHKQVRKRKYTRKH
jgi:hypothetical protein